MLTKNTDVPDGLANTAIALLKALFFPHLLQTILTSVLTDQNTSWSTLMRKESEGGEIQFKHLIPDEVSVPIPAIEMLAKKSFSKKKTQISLV